MPEATQPSPAPTVHTDTGRQAHGTPLLEHDSKPEDVAAQNATQTLGQKRSADAAGCAGTQVAPQKQHRSKTRATSDQGEKETEMLGTAVQNVACTIAQAVNAPHARTDLPAADRSTSQASNLADPQAPNGQLQTSLEQPATLRDGSLLDQRATPAVTAEQAGKAHADAAQARELALLSQQATNMQQVIDIQEAKRLQRKQKNREAAERSRQKQRDLVAALEATIAERDDQVAALEATLATRSGAMLRCSNAVTEVCAVNKLLLQKLLGGKVALAAGLQKRCMAAQAAADACIADLKADGPVLQSDLDASNATTADGPVPVPARATRSAAVAMQCDAPGNNTAMATTDAQQPGLQGTAVAEGAPTRSSVAPVWENGHATAQVTNRGAPRTTSRRRKPPAARNANVGPS